MPSERNDRVEHFLVDGVAPAVIGGGPPESPFDVPPDPEPDTAREQVPAQRSDPPTAPIPVLRPPEQRRSWVSRLLRLPER